MGIARLVAHPEAHQRAAVQQVDPAPVPARGLRGKVRARPFVVEPRLAFDVPAVQLADDMEVRAAVVVTGLARPMALAAEARVPLQDELVGEQGEVEIEVTPGDPGLVALPFQLQPPVVDPDARTSMSSAS